VGVDEAGQHEGAGKVPALGRGHGVIGGAHRLHAPGVERNARQHRHAIALRPVGGQQPARQPRVVEQHGRVHAKRAMAWPTRAMKRLSWGSVATFMW
jgi:hypothetical protein